ncbi:MAG TPA: hypothetical protein VFE54_13995 [Mucilaginibacter sp.]|jgi:Zn ribbon nucleic-acid-binding protein|nr:hypothetical protein [Mucilaginibacter sp.]
MSISEIKCPHCGEWTMWQDNVDDRCINCGAFLDSRRFSLEVEKKINKDLKKEDDYFALKPSDGPFTRELKLFFNSLRWAAYYVQLIFFAFITIMLLLVSLFAA